MEIATTIGREAGTGCCGSVWWVRLVTRLFAGLALAVVHRNSRQNIKRKPDASPARRPVAPRPSQTKLRLKHVSSECTTNGSMEIQELQRHLYTLFTVFAGRTMSSSQQSTLSLFPPMNQGRFQEQPAGFWNPNLGPVACRTRQVAGSRHRDDADGHQRYTQLRKRTESNLYIHACDANGSADVHLVCGLMTTSLNSVHSILKYYRQSSGLTLLNDAGTLALGAAALGVSCSPTPGAYYVSGRVCLHLEQPATNALVDLPAPFHGKQNIYGYVTCREGRAALGNCKVPGHQPPLHRMVLNFHTAPVQRPPHSSVTGRGGAVSST